VGQVHTTNFARTRRHPHPNVRAVGGPQPGEAKRFLRWVEKNLTALTRALPMAKLEDLPPSMQPHIVGVLQTWVQHFWHLEKVFVHYS